MKRILKRVLPVIFALAVLTGLLGRQISTKTTEDYQDLQPEFTGPDLIETVMHAPELRQLYVCYSDANFVNVYTEDGEFRWAVGTPYIRGNQFCLKDGMLVCYGGDPVYLYDAADGAFLGTADREAMDLPYDPDVAEGFRWDSFRVYDGEGNVLVDRPVWYWVFDFGLTWAIGMASGLAMVMMELLERMKADRKASRKTVLTDRRAIRYRAACIRMIAVHLGYGVVVQFHERLGPLLILGLFPIVIGFILSGWTWLNRPARWGLPEEEYAVTRFWGTSAIASLVVMMALFILAYVIF